MTREIKAGLVVSFSFLSLVGVVLANKWHGSLADAPVREDLETVALAGGLEKPKPPHRTTFGPAGGASTPAGNTVPAAAAGPAGGASTPAGNTVPAAAAPLEPVRNEAEIKLASVPGSDLPTANFPAPAVPASPSTAPAVSEPAVPTPTAATAAATSRPAAPESTTATPAPAAPPAAPISDPVPPPIPDTRYPIPGASSLPSPPAEEAKSASARPRGSKNPPSRPIIMTEPEPPPPFPKPRSQPAPLDVAGKKADASAGTAPATTSLPPASTLPSAGVNLLRPVGAPALATENVPSLPATATVPAGIGVATEPNAPRSGQGRIPTMPGINLERAPLPGAPAAGLPPEAPQAVVPQVEAYEEWTYRCKPGDTYQSISAQFYQTEKLARPLYLFNRNHPRATDSVRQEPPVLSPGQAVYIPPQRILEKRYASVIAEQVAPPPALTLQPVSPAAQPAVTSPPTPPPTPSSAWSTPKGEKFYRVKQNGETYREIAWQVLGNKDRWPEIYKLNLRFNPEYPLPGGTVLNLPTDARIDEE